MQNVGVISDTHGLLRAEAVAALKMADSILHAGDIGGPEIVERLREIAAVTAVKGNNDTGEWACEIPDRQLVEIDRVRIYILHDLKELDFAPEAEGVGVVIAGHSHRPSIEERNGVMYVNPGSAGPRRFKLPVTIGLLKIDGSRAKAEIVHLL